MHRRYALDQIRGLEISLYNPYDSTEIAHYFFHPDEEMSKINHWVEENNLGTRVSLNRWKLNDESSLSMFILKWIK
jgi:hypothetical protein